jgi:hypothetical protein
MAAMDHRHAKISIVVRRCLVCDLEQEVQEPKASEAIGAPCASCGAPTERIAVLRDQVSKDPRAVALGRLGGLKGGNARARALSPHRRREIARRAVQARWKRLKG